MKPEKLLAPGEVALRFGVHPRTVWRWGVTGKLPSVQTPTGRRLFHPSVVEAFLRSPEEPS